MDFNIDLILAKYFNKCSELARYLTLNPEISGEEVESCNYLVRFLKEQSYDVQKEYCGFPNSFLAIDNNKKTVSKKVVLLCEYDALPALGHACGHSLSCAASVLAALALNEAFCDKDIRFDIMGTPGEETLGSKAIIADKNGFDGYEYAAMAHMNNENQTSFKVLASNDKFITFRGRSSHASASPEKGLNALNAARLFMDAMDMWRQHLPTDCQIQGIICHGGDAPNIVPDFVSLDYYFRAASLENLNLVNQKAKICAEAAAMATECKVELVQRYPSYGEIFCNSYKHKYLQEVFSFVGRQSIVPEKPAGSSDVGNVDMLIPVFHPMVDCSNNQKDIPLHDKRFADLLLTPSGMNALLDSAKILCKIAIDMELNPQLAEQIKFDHAEYRLIT